MKKIIFSIFLFCFLSINDIYSRDDYPSDYIYGFVQGCYETIEQSQMLSGKFWPDHVKVICGCMMDSIREEIPFDQTIDNKSMNLMFEVSAFILPECIRKMTLKAEI
tara:strand:+ start:564 stop:884 length:321 start_codon:yes stop_codon:yes gene_type:complete